MGNPTRVRHRGENLCTPIQRCRTYSLSQGLPNHASIRQIRELFAYALEIIIAHLHGDGALMQGNGQQIRANVHTCAGCGTVYTIWPMYWWRILLELRLLLLSTAYSVSGSPGLVLGADALLKPSFKIPGPRSRSQGQLFASGDPTGIPLGLAHLGSTCRLLAPADYGKTGPRTSI